MASVIPEGLGVEVPLGATVPVRRPFARIIRRRMISVAPDASYDGVIILTHAVEVPAAVPNAENTAGLPLS
jgi:hypothetical protein